MRRVILGVATLATLAVPVAIATVTLAPAANAGSSLTCTKLKGTETGTVTVSKCSVVSADKKTYKSLSGSALNLATGGTLTWTSSGATTIVGPPTLSTPTGGCKATKPGKAPTQTETLATGTVTGGTSAVTHAGDTYRIEICITTKNGKLALVKGTSVSL